MCEDVCGCAWMCVDVCGCVWMCVDVCACARVCECARVCVYFEKNSDEPVRGRILDPFLVYK